MIVEKVTTKQWIGLIGISLLAFTIFLDVTIVSNTLPSIQKALHATDTELQWLLNTIYIAMCALMATFGRIGDVYGLRKVFYSSMVIMALASLACGLSQSIQMLIFFRAIQGITLGSLTISAALVSHNFPASYHAKTMAVFFAIGGMGLALGPVVGGVIVQLLSWRWVFFINVPIVAIGLVICFLCVTEQKEHDHQETVDWIGAIFFIITIVSLVTTIMQGSNWGWNSPMTLSGFVIALVGAIGFVITELKVKMPLMPFALLANSVFISAAMTCATCGCFIAVLLFFNPIYLQNILQYSAIYSGWLLFSSSLVYVLISPVAGFITHRFSPKTGTWLTCLLLMIAAYFHSLFGMTPSLIIILIGFVAFGMAWGMVNVPPVVAVMQTISPKNAGVTLGSLWTLFNLGSSLGLALLGLLFRSLTGDFLQKNLITELNSFNGNQLRLLHQLVLQPENSQSIINQFPMAEGHHIMAAYQAAFIHSYHIVAMVLFILATIAFFIVLCFMKNLPIHQHNNRAIL